MRTALLIAIVVGSALLVNPLYNYPVGDDWTYALSVKHLYETGHLRLADESAASIIFHVLWGCLFCLPFGFSFGALHLSTLALSLGGLIGFYKLCERLTEMTAAQDSASPWLPLVVTLTLWFNPIYFTLSFTFYTDVPFYALMILALTSFVLSQTNRRREILFFSLGCLFSTGAVLVRQYAIVLPLAVAILLAARVWKVRSGAIAGLLLMVPVAALAGFYYWLATHHGMPTQFRFAQLEMLKTYRIARDVYRVPIMALFYGGLFFLPLSLALLGREGLDWYRARVKHRHTEERRGGTTGGHFTVRCSVGLLLGVTAVIIYVASDRLMPYLTDSPIFPHGGRGLSLALTLGSVMSAAVLVELIGISSWSWLRDVFRRRARVILLATGGVLLINAILASGVLDRTIEQLVDRALVAYYVRYSSEVPTNQSLDYWRGRVGEFSSGAKRIFYSVGFVGVILSLVARSIRRRLGSSGDRQGAASSPEVTLSLATILLLVGMFVVISCRFDRYIFIVFPFALAASYRSLAVKKIPLWGAAGGILVLALISLASTKTMISGYAALFRAGEELLRRGVPLEQINLTYTFNAWMLYQQGHRTIERTGQPSYWVYAARPDFVYFGGRPDGPARVVVEVPFTNYLRLRRERVQVWEKLSASPMVK